MAQITGSRRSITIADARSDHKPKKKITLELEGGSPWFTYVWIDDQLYVLTKANNAKIKRVK